MLFEIRTMLPEDWPAVRKIYEEGISTGNATFETELPDWHKWNSNHRQNCRLVASNANEILGWAALTSVSVRQVYSGVAEVSLYVAAVARGRGLGKALLQALVNESEADGVWTLQAGIFPENTVSIAVHESCGFRKVGIRSRIGKLDKTWRDVFLLERRSSKVGN
jgi:L-amino acid N-acyltransferase YncA